MRSIFIAASIVAIVSTVTQATAQDYFGLDARLEATLADFHARYNFPGATAAIALPDGTVVTAATGLADLENNLTMTPETPMLAASIGKTFVAATVLALESEGRLARTDLLAAHLGDRHWFASLPNARTITIGHLLQHSAGLPDHIQLPEFKSWWSRMATSDVMVDYEELVGLVTGKAPLFGAGTGWSYSDTGYLLLGLVIEKVSGAPWTDSVRERFLGPLKLSGTLASDRRILPGLAVGYVALDNPFSLPERTADAGGRLLWDPAVEGAGGGLASTSHDLALWGHLLFRGEAMSVPYLDRLLEGIPVSPEVSGVLYGAGVAIYSDTPRGVVYGNGGWIPGYVSSLRHYADHGVTVVFQINTDRGFLDNSSDLVPALEAALADLAIEAAQ
ncbi:MAG: serine hydrolase domain-containing protein [Pseudohongiella sp.]|nr:serine hydrolase domain-containing protein [Pseudohongiella sp.]